MGLSDAILRFQSDSAVAILFCFFFIILLVLLLDDVARTNVDGEKIGWPWRKLFFPPVAI
jgi:hypothetical protein